MNVIITGAGRGIGLALVKTALSQGHRVLAVVRDLGGNSELGLLIKTYSDMTLLETDVTKDLSELSRAAQKMGFVDILINNAGILREGDSREDFVETFAVNSIAPHFVTLNLLPELKKSKNPKVINITSLMGSISDNRSGRYYSYRASKAALNAITVSLAKDQPWLTVLLVHPGWVKTRMGGEQAPVSPQESAQGIWALALEARKNQSGQFFDFRGQSINW